MCVSDGFAVGEGLDPFVPLAVDELPQAINARVAIPRTRRFIRAGMVSDGIRPSSQPQREKRVCHLPAVRTELDLLGRIKRRQRALRTRVRAEAGAVEEFA